ncbi:MAG: hypothetical protein HQL27_02745, partial [Candidatus Omnitrophica bacterium]|nr:hypothetical protein [Candidatus Omnitrophota bacterium]
RKILDKNPNLNLVNKEGFSALDLAYALRIITRTTYTDGNVPPTTSVKTTPEIESLITEMEKAGAKTGQEILKEAKEKSGNPSPDRNMLAEGKRIREIEKLLSAEKAGVVALDKRPEEYLKDVFGQIDSLYSRWSKIQEEIKTALAENLLAIRIKKGLPQAKVYHRPALISRLERGKYSGNIYQSDIAEIAENLKVSQQSLIPEYSKKKKAQREINEDLDRAYKTLILLIEITINAYHLNSEDLRYSPEGDIYGPYIKLLENGKLSFSPTKRMVLGLLQFVKREKPASVPFSIAEMRSARLEKLAKTGFARDFKKLLAQKGVNINYIERPYDYKNKGFSIYSLLSGKTGIYNSNFKTVAFNFGIDLSPLFDKWGKMYDEALDLIGQVDKRREAANNFAMNLLQGVDIEKVSRKTGIGIRRLQDIQNYEHESVRELLGRKKWTEGVLVPNLASLAPALGKKFTDFWPEKDLVVFNFDQAMLSISAHNELNTFLRTEKGSNIAHQLRHINPKIWFPVAVELLEELREQQDDDYLIKDTAYRRNFLLKNGENDLASLTNGTVHMFGNAVLIKINNRNKAEWEKVKIKIISSGNVNNQDLSGLIESALLTLTSEDRKYAPLLNKLKIILQFDPLFSSRNKAEILEILRSETKEIIDTCHQLMGLLLNKGNLDEFLSSIEAGTDTLAVIKPDGIEFKTQILESLEAAGFEISVGPEISMSEAQAREFYKVHEGKPFFEKDLIPYITSGPVIPLRLTRKEGNTVKTLRDLLPGLREKLGSDKVKNRIHASDSKENAATETQNIVKFTDSAMLSLTQAQAESQIRQFLATNPILPSFHHYPKTLWITEAAELLVELNELGQNAESRVSFTQAARKSSITTDWVVKIQSLNPNSLIMFALLVSERIMTKNEAKFNELAGRLKQNEFNNQDLTVFIETGWLANIYEKIKSESSGNIPKLRRIIENDKDLAQRLRQNIIEVLTFPWRSPDYTVLQELIKLLLKEGDPGDNYYAKYEDERNSFWDFGEDVELGKVRKGAILTIVNKSNEIIEIFFDHLGNATLLGEIVDDEGKAIKIEDIRYLIVDSAMLGNSLKKIFSLMGFSQGYFNPQEAIAADKGISRREAMGSLAGMSLAAFTISVLGFCPGCGKSPTEPIDEQVKSWSDEKLISGLDDGKWEMQKACARELYARMNQKGIELAQNNLIWPRIEQLTPAEYYLVSHLEAYNQIIELGEITTGPLMQNLQDPNAQTDTRKWSARLLSSVGNFDTVIWILLEVIRSSDGGIYAWWHREEAQRGLPELFHRQTTEKLWQLADSSDEYISYYAREELIDRGEIQKKDQAMLGNEPLPKLTPMQLTLEEDGDIAQIDISPLPEDRILKSLGELVSTIISQLTDPNPLNRQIGLEQLPLLTRMLDPEQMLEIYRKSIENPIPGMQIILIQALAKSGLDPQHSIIKETITNNADISVINAAEEAFKSQGLPEENLIPIYLTALDSAEESPKINALRRMASLGEHFLSNEQITELFFRGLTDESPMVRFAAEEALSKIGVAKSKRAIMFTQILAGNNPRVLSFAVSRLGELGDTSAIPPLFRLRDRTNIKNLPLITKINYAVNRILTAYPGDNNIRQEDSSSEQTDHAMLVSLPRISIRKLLQQLESAISLSGNDLFVAPPNNPYSLNISKNNKPSVVDKLSELLLYDDPLMREDARAIALSSGLNRWQKLSLYKRVIASPYPYEQKLAITTLAELKIPSAWDIIRERIAVDPEDEIINFSEKTLRDNGFTDDDLIPDYLKALDGEEEAPKIHAILRLLKIKDSLPNTGIFIDKLFKNLNDPSQFVRWWADQALKALKVGHIRLVSHYIKALNHKNGFVRVNAVMKLEELKDARAIKALEKLRRKTTETFLYLRLTHTLNIIREANGITTKNRPSPLAPDENLQLNQSENEETPSAPSAGNSNLPLMVPVSGDDFENSMPNTIPDVILQSSVAAATPDMATIENLSQSVKDNAMLGWAITIAGVGISAFTIYQIWLRNTVSGNLERLKGKKYLKAKNALANLGATKEQMANGYLLALTSRNLKAGINAGLTLTEYPYNRSFYKPLSGFIKKLEQHLIKLNKWFNSLPESIHEPEWIPAPDPTDNNWDVGKDIPNPEREKLGEEISEIRSAIDKIKMYLGNSLLGNNSPGGIDMNEIPLDRKGAARQIQFDGQMLEGMIDDNIQGFVPVIINIVPIQSVLPLLGLKKEAPRITLGMAS